MPPTADAELARLLDAYGQAEYEWGSTSHTRAGMHGELGRRQHATMDDARAALLAHIAARYVRRDQLTPDEWDDLDATAPEMERHGAR